MYSPGGGVSHDIEHQQLTRRLQSLALPVAALVAASAANSGQVVSYLGLEWVSDGTRWLSKQIFDTAIATRTTTALPQATTVFSGVFNQLHSIGGVYLVGLDCSFAPQSIAQSGTNFYTLSGLVQANANSPVAAGITLSGTQDTKTFTTTGVPYEMSYALTQAIPAAYHRASLTMTASAAPGTFFFEAVLSYRLIGG